jgi:hypothetical protein
MIKNQIPIQLKVAGTKDLIKARMFKEKEKNQESQRKKREDLLKRSSRRFHNSPFSTNFIGLNEIFEVNQKHKLFSNTSKNLKKLNNFSLKGEKLVKKLKKNLRNIEKSEKLPELTLLKSFILRQQLTSREMLKKKVSFECPRSFSLKFKGRKV